MLPTKEQFFNEYKEDIGEKEFINLYSNIDNEYYELVEHEVKKGNVITQEVYSSLSEGQRYHFNKNYNHNNDKVA